MTTTHAIGHVSRWALTLVLLAALGGCYLLDPAPPVRPGATEDFDAVVAKIRQLDGVGSTSYFDYTGSGIESDSVTVRIDVEDGYDPVDLIDAALRELYWFGEYASAPVGIWARTADGQRYNVHGAITRNGAEDWLYSEDIEERYGP